MSPTTDLCERRALAAFTAHEIIRRGDGEPGDAARRGASAWKADPAPLVTTVRGRRPAEALAALRPLFTWITVALLVLLGCRTPDPWAARGAACVERCWPDAGRARAEVAIEMARLVNPIGEHAAMTHAERQAALARLLTGYERALQEAGGAGGK